MWKRVVAQILNRLIILIPAILLLGGISLLLYPDYFIFGKDDSGWLMVTLYKYMLFLPLVFMDLISRPSAFWQVIEIILPSLMCIIIIETISIRLLKRDVGMKIMGLRLESIQNKSLTLSQIIVRTTLKYFSLAFFPFVLIYPFINKDKMTLHDKLSRTRVVWVQGIKLVYL